MDPCVNPTRAVHTTELHKLPLDLERKTAVGLSTTHVQMLLRLAAWALIFFPEATSHPRLHAAHFLLLLLTTSKLQYAFSWGSLMSTIHQDILSDRRYPRTITVRNVLADDAARQLAQTPAAFAGADTIFIGISYHISEKGNPDFICLASSTHAFTISVGPGTRTGSKSFAALLRSGDTPSHDPSELSPALCLVGFGMARIAIQVRQATGLHIKGVDLSSLSNSWQPLAPSKFIADRVDARVDRFAVARLWMGDEISAERDIVLQAWLAACAASRCELKTAERVDTRHLNLSEQPCLALLVAQSDLLEWNKPKEVPSDFSRGGINKQGKYELHNSRYKTRVRKGEQCQIILTDMKGNEFVGRARQMKGKTTTIAFQDQKHPGEGLRHVKVVGRPDPTNPEKAQNEFILLVMRGMKTLRDSPFIRMVWFPHWKPLNVEPTIVNFQDADGIVTKIGLNESQRAAVHAMVGALPLVVVHGPPGTGKTTTIAAASRIWDMSHLPVWIVAHSNVAVKNIAETLFKKDVNFKLLVSKEFYVEWHEHLYHEIEERLIRSDELPKQKIEMEQVIGDSTIILCTLSMISNPALDGNGTFEVVPFNRLVIDEASQINTFEFMHIFAKFQNVLEKVCFFGDPNQLPPYGHENVPEMKTIFEFDHLKRAGVVQFLDIQYRMPEPIAAFISQSIYDRRLRSSSHHPVDGPDCLAFIDASQKEEERAGFSTRNWGEVDTVVHLVRNYYRWKNFCIITPYDAQRAVIQRRLEDEKLPWETVYNVDSFQGNEADYVIVSVVRSSHSGFLRSRNRMNVLLTRCRRGLVIVSGRSFLGDKGSGSNTLLGRLVGHWQSKYPHQTWIDWRSVASASVDLPGAAGTKSASLKVHPPVVSSVTMPHTPKRFVSPSTLPLGRQRQPYQITFADIASFPPLASKQPLLKGSWGAVLQPVHPLSLVSRRGQLLPDAAKASCQSKLPSQTTRRPWDTFATNTPPSTELNASNQQRPFIHKLRQNTIKTKQPKRSQKPDSGPDSKQQTSKPVIPVQSTGFIRSITIHNGITSVKKSGFAKH